MLNEEDEERLKEIFIERMEECEGCPFYREWAERLTWIHPEPEGRVMCMLLGGAGENIDDCQIIKADNEKENEDEGC